MNARSLFLCLTAAAALQSCWLPPFDPELSASQYTIGLLGDPVWSARIKLENQGEGGWYLPPKEPSQYGQGVWVREESGRIFLWALRSYEWGYAQLDHIYEGDNNLGRARLLSMAAGFNSNYVFISDPSQGIRRVGYGTTDPPWNTLFPPDEYYIGFGVGPVDQVNDRYCMVRLDPAIPQFSFDYAPMNSYTAMPPTILTNGVIDIPPPIPAAPGFFAISPTDDRTYLSAPYGDGSIRTYAWLDPMPSPPVRLPIDRQLTGILSDGRLLADGGDELYVYGPEGASLFAIRTGPLRFVHERYHSDPLVPANSRWLSVFSRTVRIPKDKDDSAEYLIEVFEIPTADLKKLTE